MSESIPVKWQRVIAAADGYADLEMPRHARAELDTLPQEYRTDHTVIWVRYRIAYLEERWENAMMLADELRVSSSVKDAAWISMAVACRRARGLEEAITILEEGKAIYPSNPLFAYNLACYHCLLGRNDQARDLLREALAMEPSMQQIALYDDDLAELRDDIKLRVFLKEREDEE